MMAPLRCCPRPPSPLPKDTVIHPSIWVKHIWTCQTVWHTYGLYLWYVTTFHVIFLSVTHHVRTYVHTYIHTYLRAWSSIQSLALMRSAITTQWIFYANTVQLFAHARTVDKMPLLPIPMWPRNKATLPLALVRALGMSWDIIYRLPASYCGFVEQRCDIQ